MIMILLDNLQEIDNQKLNIYEKNNNYSINFLIVISIVIFVLILLTKIDKLSVNINKLEDKNKQLEQQLQQQQQLNKLQQEDDMIKKLQNENQQLKKELKLEKLKQDYFDGEYVCSLKQLIEKQQQDLELVRNVIYNYQNEI